MTLFATPTQIHQTSSATRKNDPPLITVIVTRYTPYRKTFLQPYDVMCLIYSVYLRCGLNHTCGIYSMPYHIYSLYVVCYLVKAHLIVTGHVC